MFGLKWYDYLWFPWTVNKALWNQIRGLKKPEPEDVPQQSSYSYPLPLVYGRKRITPKLMLMWVESIGGGRFAFTSQYALCEGPITGFGRVWVDKDLRNSPTELGITSSLGSRPTQTTWSALTGARAIGYPGIAWVGYYVPRYHSVEPGTPSQLSFEVQGKLDATGDATNGDAHPADILKGSVATPASSMLCEPNFGAGFPFTVEVENGRDGTAATSYRRYTTAAGLWISPAFTEQRPASEHLQEVLESTNASCLWTSGLLEIVPLGDQSVTGNSVTYTPPVTIQYALTKDDFLAQDDGSLLTIELESTIDVPNIVQVEFLERAPTGASTDPANAYNASIAEDGDPVDVLSVRGEKRGPKIALHAISLRPVAQTIARIRAQRMVQARNRYRFRLPWRFVRLEPLDFVSLTDSLLGLNAVPVRIESIEEDPETYELEVEAVEWPFGTGNAVPHTTQSSDGPIAPTQTFDHVLMLAARNFTKYTLPAAFTSNQPRDIAWSPNLGLWCVVGGNTACATSPDGVTWTAQTIPAGGYFAVVWAPGLSLFVAVGGSVCATSPDGVTWTARTIPAGSYSSIVWNGSLLCAVGTGTNFCSTSPDGINWTARTIVNGMQAVAWNANLGLFCAINTTGTIARTSPDGITWTSRTVPTGTYQSIIATQYGFCAIGNSGLCITSPDGITWTTRSLPSDVSSRSFTALVTTDTTNPVLCAFSTSGTPASAGIFSVDFGITWQSQQTGINPGVFSGASWNGQRFCTLWQSGSDSSVFLSLAVQV